MTRLCKRCVNCEECKNDKEFEDECTYFDYIYFEQVYNKKKLEDE